MRSKPRLSSHLYIRIDDDMRLALKRSADAGGISISDLARRELRKALAIPMASVPAAAGANPR